MTRTFERQKSDLVAAAASQADKRLKGEKAKALKQFIEAYYQHVPPHDLLSATPETLFSAAVSHWKFGEKRKPGEACVRVFNANVEEHGWRSDHTIVEIIVDDKPFLVDSVTAELNRMELTVHLVIHPVFSAKRDGSGKLQSIQAPGTEGKGITRESFMHVKVTEQSGEMLAEIEANLKSVMNDVNLAVADWSDMRDAMLKTIEATEKTPPKKIKKADLEESIAFLRWLHDNHFTFLGARDYIWSVKGSGPKKKMTVERKDGLGLLRDPSRRIFEGQVDERSLAVEIDAFIKHPDLLMVTKTNVKSTVHRRVHMDAVSVKILNKSGEAIGQRIFVGLFTSVAYNRSPRDIPLLREKMKQVLDRAGFPQGGHDFKALVNIIETFPRDELLQVSTEHLFNTALGVLNLQDRQRVAIFIRRDELERFISCLIYVPRDRYTTALRERMQKILEKDFNGEVAAFYTQLGDSPLARLHIIIDTTPGQIPDYDPDAIEAQLVDTTRSWTDQLTEALFAAYGEEKGMRLSRRYRHAFPAGYTEQLTADEALVDIEKIEAMLQDGNLGMCVYRAVDESDNAMRFKIYHQGRPVPLSDVLPMLEHMGFKVVDEVPHELAFGKGEDELIYIHDFGMVTRSGADVALGDVRGNFQDAFLRVWQGKVESDGFNALVIGAKLAWREVVVLRAIAKYLRQAGIAFSQSYMEQTLANNAGITRAIVDLFITRFDPNLKGDRAKETQTLVDKIEADLEAVSSADEDRIIRRFVNLVLCMLRTNFFQTTATGEPKPYVSFKLNSAEIEELPLPRPFREIWVYGPDVEGVHLRFGMVARGGLRWSDRREDFRTEILGLVKAQQVKNSVIVPVGAKGGFVVKNPPTAGGREAFLEEGIRCYKLFISGLLDITDNLKQDKIVPPKVVTRHDGDDPYLVVAADKGTATFSDIANGVSIEYGHWLGDAFASGGSQGYDHKKMGITARGAWESVKRHFREIGIDTQTTDFTCVGVGDMAGDVFGNGMLLSEHIRLIGAFNHMHIFVDPNPDPASSFKERKRLFELPRSTWMDYDKKVLSKGAMIYERSAKSIKLTPEIKKALDIIKDTVTPNELIHALLTARVDLLWFGGIGTYVKHSDESNADVGDRANDAIRVSAPELRCQVIGEGANLGCTQRGRIEFAIEGGRMNTDSIDNSAGVDCSDHEVNIKILLDNVTQAGDLTEKQRNKLLADMTDEVAGLVLRHNYQQSQAITHIQAKGWEALDDQQRLIRFLERAGRLNRAVEFLPDDETITERVSAKQGLTRPEIAILMSYAKIWLYDELLASDVPDDQHLLSDLTQYFPTPLREKYKKQINKHRLKREIITTRVTNSMINRVGGTFLTRFMEKTGMDLPEIAKAYTVCRDVFRLREIWEGIEKLDNTVEASAQTAMLIDVNNLIEWVTLWFLRNGERPMNINNSLGEFCAGIGELMANIDKVLPSHYVDDIRDRGRPYVEAGVPEKLAYQVSGLVNLYSGCDIVRLANRKKLDVTYTAKLYFAVGTRFRLGRLRAATDNLEPETHWQKLAAAALIEEIYDHQLALTWQVMDQTKKDTDPETAIEDWMKKNRAAVDRAESLLGELWSGDISDLSMIAVASRSLRALAGVVPH